MSEYIYKVIASDEEKDICSLEARAMLGQSPKWFGQEGFVQSSIAINISRSPYMKWRLDVHFNTTVEEKLIYELAQLHPTETFKFVWLATIKNNERVEMSKLQLRKQEGLYGSFIKGKLDLKKPAIQYGCWMYNGVAYFGVLNESVAHWQQHAEKPRQYSTALSTRLARTVVNIAVPQPTPALRFVDPCCGIGTVLLEAAALGIDTYGFDLNPVVLKGTRENLNHFDYNVEVFYRDMLTLEEQYDVALLDLPYNICSVLPEQQKVDMLKKVDALANRYVIVSAEPIADLLRKLGMPIVDYAEHYKGKFKREVYLCCKQ